MKGLFFFFFFFTDDGGGGGGGPNWLFLFTRDPEEGLFFLLRQMIADQK
jgi:hypothetical protein